MAEARGRLEWAQSSLILAILWNANSTEKLQPDDFSPYPSESAPDQVIRGDFKDFRLLVMQR